MPDIRAAEALDATPLAALAERTFRDAFAAMNTPDDMHLHCAARYSKAMQRKEILDPGMQTLVCEHNGQLIGFAQLRWDPGPACVSSQRPAELQRLYVAKEWHGRGVAQDLMARTIGLAEANGADQVWLGVWERNPRAIAFYTKCGFIEVGEQVFLLGTDRQRDIVMHRQSTRNGGPCTT